RVLRVPAVTVAALEDLVGRPHLLVGSARHAERVAEGVDVVLVGSGDASAHAFLADTVGTLPVGVDVTARELGARGRVLCELFLDLSLRVGAEDRRLPGRRALQLFLARFGRLARLLL